MKNDLFALFSYQAPTWSPSVITGSHSRAWYLVRGSRTSPTFIAVVMSRRTCRPCTTKVSSASPGDSCLIQGSRTSLTFVAVNNRGETASIKATVILRRNPYIADVSSVCGSDWHWTVLLLLEDVEGAKSFCIWLCTMFPHPSLCKRL